jgi:hypothetical protein
MRRFRSVIILAAIAAVSVPLLVAPPASAATPPVVNVQSNNSSIGVNVQAAAGVAGISAEIFDDETGARIGATNVFTLVFGTATNGTWRSEHLVLPEYDYHDVVVTVTDNDGVSTVATGTLHYLIILSLADLTYSRTTITYAKRSVTVRGRVLATPPDTGVAVPISWKVGLAAAVGTAINVASGADGTFAGTVTFTGFVDSVIAVADFDGARPEYYWSGTYDMYPTVKPAPTRLSLQLSRVKVRVGQTVTANGTLTRNLGEGYVPVAGAPVAVQWCVTASSCTSVGSVTTDAGGNYATTYAPTATGWFQLTHVPSGPDSQLLGSATKSSRLITVLPPATARR